MILKGPKYTQIISYIMVILTIHNSGFSSCRHQTVDWETNFCVVGTRNCKIRFRISEETKVLTIVWAPPFNVCGDFSEFTSSHAQYQLKWVIETFFQCNSTLLPHANEVAGRLCCQSYLSVYREGPQVNMSMCTNSSLCIPPPPSSPGPIPQTCSKLVHLDLRNTSPQTGWKAGCWHSTKMTSF